MSNGSNFNRTQEELTASTSIDSPAKAGDPAPLLPDTAESTEASEFIPEAMDAAWREDAVPRDRVAVRWSDGLRCIAGRLPKTVLDCAEKTRQRLISRNVRTRLSQGLDRIPEALAEVAQYDGSSGYRGIL